jgi:hypothetical protein
MVSTSSTAHPSCNLAASAASFEASADVGRQKRPNEPKAQVSILAMNWENSWSMASFTRALGHLATHELNLAK